MGFGGQRITLKGVNANIRIGAYSVDGVAQSSTSSMNEDFWGIQLIAPECRPERILEVNQQDTAAKPGVLTETL